MGISRHDGTLTGQRVRSLNVLTSDELAGGGTIEPGEVLVTRSTDPTWTPLILQACAVVMETGGPLQHAAIVAREQGIPAVTGIDRITERLADGARIRVDGEAGTVVRLAGASPSGRGAVHDLERR